MGMNKKVKIMKLGDDMKHDEAVYIKPKFSMYIMNKFSDVLYVPRKHTKSI